MNKGWAPTSVSPNTLTLGSHRVGWRPPAPVVSVSRGLSRCPFQPPNTGLHTALGVAWFIPGCVKGWRPRTGDCAMSCVYLQALQEALWAVPPHCSLIC